MQEQRLIILMVPFDVIDLKKAVEKLHQAILRKEQCFCVTPNPEICLIAQDDPDYLRLLQSAQMSIPDGFGILWASRFYKGRNSTVRWLWTLLTPWQTRIESPFPERVTGTDLMQEFCRKHPDKRVFLLGASDEINTKLAQKLKAGGVNIVGHLSSDDRKKNENHICKAINDSATEVLFVAFGAPKQEQWIARNLPRLPSVRVAIGVGGAFDFLTGHRKRAPRIMRRFGLEWLYRLAIEPKRMGRIFRATVIFPWRVLRKSHQP